MSRGRPSRGGAGATARPGGSQVGAQEAFASLVHQFSDPFAFLRELVQNALDAGSTLIEVDFAWAAAERPGQKGLVTITVVDNGEGMDEAIIDGHLLTMFSSTKEGDLTKIGRFGIGFVSVFAMKPELVTLETGRPGQSWRLLLYPDGRYDKLALNAPVEGTTISLYLRRDRAGFDAVRARGAEVVRHWCKFAEAEILVEGAPIAEPFELDAPLRVHHQEPGTEMWLGLAPLRDGEPVPRVGLFNRGLTLVETTAVPGAGPELAGLSLIARSRYLEHTLTRDDVRQDEAYARLLQILREKVATELVPRLLEVATRAAATREPAERARLNPSPAALLRYLRLPMVDRRAMAALPLLATIDGPPVSVASLRRRTAGRGSLLVAHRSSAVTALLASRGEPALRHVEGIEAFSREVLDRELEPANERHHTALPVQTSAHEDVLLAAVHRLLSGTNLRFSRLFWGSLDHPDSSATGRLMIRQHKAFGLTCRGVDDTATLFGGARELVVNVDAGLTRHCCALAERDLALAALLLAQQIAEFEGCAPAEIAALAGPALRMLAEHRPVEA